MKKLLLILLFSFIIHSSLFIANCSAQWVRQNYPTQKQVNSIHFLDTFHGWMCAGNISTTDSAMIFCTSDGGNNWVKQYGSDSTLLYKIRFADLNTGYCAGIRLTLAGIGYTLLKTTNGGINWTWLANPLNSDADLSDIEVINRDTIYGCSEGGFTNGIFKSTDGGQSFTRTYNPSTGKLFFTDYNHGWGIVGSFYLVRTTDAGVNWTTVGNWGSNGIGDIYFINPNTGWIIEGLYLLRSSNGGLNWTTLDSSCNCGNFMKTFLSVFFVDANTGWSLFGERYTGSYYKPIIFKTTNGGSIWGYQDLADSAFSNSVFFIDNNYGWVYGSSGKGNKTINSGGIFTYLGITTNTKIPEQFVLFQNYPNPFNSQTVISFSLLKQSYATLKIYDMTGKEKTIWHNNKLLDAGTHQISFDANNLSSGVYFYQLTIKNEKLTEVYNSTKKMILIK